jgi:hypothetical protein
MWFRGEKADTVAAVPSCLSALLLCPLHDTSVDTSVDISTPRLTFLRDPEVLCGLLSEFTGIFNYISNPGGSCLDSSLREDLLIHPEHDYDPKG